MKPLQVYLADTEFARLDAWARERGWTKSQAIRAAVRALTRTPGEDPILAMSGMIHDELPADCSQQLERYLQGTFVAESSPPYRKSLRRPRARPRR